MAQLTSVINVNLPKEVKEEARVISFEAKEGNSQFSKHLLDALEEGDAILKGKKDTKSYTNAREMVEDILKDNESTQ